ncbi:MAG TPA: zf-HC2 domain-containing protein [Marmoricola sp.]|jgi:hypothetical protein|nr:zf-HC2 domain-containing protein [Marmoricola sp.]
MTDCGFEHEDGAYVLGALSPEDRVAFERHLPGCDECARSVRELAGLPGLLARVPVESLDPIERPVPVPETLLPALVRRARSSQRRRTWVAAGLVAAAAAAASVVAIGIHHDNHAPTSAPVATAAPTLLSPVGSVPISGWVSLTPVSWGTRLDLTCTYAIDGEVYPPQKTFDYVMYVTRTDGTTERVSSWAALPGKTMHVSAGTAVPRSQIQDVEIRTDSGRTVLDLDGRPS